MRHPILILTLFVSPLLYGQTDDQIKEIIKTDMYLRLTQGTLIYTIYPDKFKLNLIEESINNAPLIKFKTDSNTNFIYDSVQMTLIPEDSIVLTKEEKALLIKHFQIADSSKWLSTFIPDSKFVSNDTLTNIFSNSDKGWEYFYKTYGNGFYTFLKPIFIREQTICLYYSEYNCGFTCGHGSVKVLKKENGVWRWFTELANWIS